MDYDGFCNAIKDSEFDQLGGKAFRVLELLNKRTAEILQLKSIAPRNVSSWGQNESLSHAFEQLCSQTLFQPLELHRDGGLSDKELFACFGHRTCLHDFEKSQQLGWIKINARQASPSWYMELFGSKMIVAKLLLLSMTSLLDGQRTMGTFAMLDIIARTKSPVTQRMLVEQMRKLGIQFGDILLVHSSLSRLGWVVGGEQTVVAALLEVVGASGTLVMPTHTPDNTNPANWRNPPVPESWWPTIRNAMPAFDPSMTPTKSVGRIAETFRKFPGVMRSSHPIGSFAAWGQHAADLVAPHPLEPMFGDPSPIGRLYDLDAKVLLLGVGYDTCTSLHLAEYRFVGKKRLLQEGTAMIVDGRRSWIEFLLQALETDDFDDIGEAFEKSHSVVSGGVGNALAKVFGLRKCVDFGVEWMNVNREK